MNRELDFAHKVPITTTEYTTEKVGALVGGFAQSGSGYCSLYVDNENIGFTGTVTQIVSIEDIPAGIPIKLTGSPNGSYRLNFIPYK